MQNGKTQNIKSGTVKRGLSPSQFQYFPMQIK